MKSLQPIILPAIILCLTTFEPHSTVVVAAGWISTTRSSTVSLTTTAQMKMAAFGYCNRCQQQHRIPTTDAARYHARILRNNLESTGRLDFDSHSSSSSTSSSPPNSDSDIVDVDGSNNDRNHNPLLDVSCLYEIRGKMFGVLVTEDSITGEEVILKSFAGKIRNYGWNLDGWVNSIVTPEDIPRFVELRDNVSLITSKMDQAAASSIARNDDNNDIEEQLLTKLTKQRVNMSREALLVLRNEQRITNFRGEVASLSEIFTTGPGKMPVGTGDCCATKLIAAATVRNLRPTGIAEFFIGYSKNRRVNDGQFYDSCESRCQQVLGFMLCGMDNDDDDKENLVA